MYSLRRLNAGANSYASLNEKFKETDLKQKKRGGTLRARPHQAKLPTCERELKKSLCSKGNWQIKDYANVSLGGGQVPALGGNRTWQLFCCCGGGFVFFFFFVV